MQTKTHKKTLLTLIATFATLLAVLLSFFGLSPGIAKADDETVAPTASTEPDWTNYEETKLNANDKLSQGWFKFVFTPEGTNFWVAGLLCSSDSAMETLTIAFGDVSYESAVAWLSTKESFDELQQERDGEKPFGEIEYYVSEDVRTFYVKLPSDVSTIPISAFTFSGSVVYDAPTDVEVFKLTEKVVEEPDEPTDVPSDTDDEIKDKVQDLADSAGKWLEENTGIAISGGAIILFVIAAIVWKKLSK